MYGSHGPHMAIEYLNVARTFEEVNFKLYLILIKT